MGPENPEDPGSPLVPKGWEFLQAFMPALSKEGYFSKKLNIEFTYHSLDTILDSSEFTPLHWSVIANLIELNYKKYDGFIIIHGTDTMAYTASALSFALRNLGKPVVLTGSQLPVFHPRTDAINNLSNAIHIAAASAFGIPVIPEVVISFYDAILRGNRATKSSSRAFSGFDSPSFQSLGTFNESIRIHEKYICEIPKGQFHLKPEFETNVIVITLFPGFNTDVFYKLAEDEHLKGIILRTFGSGNAPTSEGFLQSIENVIKSGKMVLNISQCMQGQVNMNKYKTGNLLSKIGVIGGSDLTLEAATAKLMWVLANYSGEEKKSALETNLCGEMT